MHPLKQRVIDIYGQEPENLKQLGDCIISVLNSIKIDHKEKLQVAGLAFDVNYSDNVSCSHNAPLGCHTNWTGDKTDADGNNCPTSYPGYAGRVWVRYKNNPQRCWSSDTFRQTLTYPGTGGGGSYTGLWTQICSRYYDHAGGAKQYGGIEHPHCYSWDYKFFLQDWPAIEKQISLERAQYNLELEEYEKQLVWAEFKGEYLAPFKQFKPQASHVKFEWEDPIVKLADNKFLNEYPAKIKTGFNW